MCVPTSIDWLSRANCNCDCERRRSATTESRRVCNARNVRRRVAAVLPRDGNRASISNKTKISIIIHSLLQKSRIKNMY